MEIKGQPLEGDFRNRWTMTIKHISRVNMPKVSVGHLKFVNELIMQAAQWAEIRDKTYNLDRHDELCTFVKILIVKIPIYDKTIAIN